MLLNILQSYKLYIEFGARSNKKIDYFHNYIKTELEKIYENVEMEKNIKSFNSSTRKKCDIVVYKNDMPYIVFPIKMIMSNYKQNKNNSWENLTGELMHLKWSNPNIHIIPINIFMNTTPYLQKNSVISKFEKITYDDIYQYDKLKTENIAYDIINYIIDVQHNNKIGEKFSKSPDIIGFNEKTPFRSFETILQNIM